jgi:hypothetical protein
MLHGVLIYIRLIYALMHLVSTFSKIIYKIRPLNCPRNKPNLEDDDLDTDFYHFNCDSQ